MTSGVQPFTLQVQRLMTRYVHRDCVATETSVFAELMSMESLNEVYEALENSADTRKRVIDGRAAFQAVVHAWSAKDISPDDVVNAMYSATAEMSTRDLRSLQQVRRRVLATLESDQEMILYSVQLLALKSMVLFYSVARGMEIADPAVVREATSAVLDSYRKDVVDMLKNI